MAEHILKTLPQYWDAIEGGGKNFEVRRDDRGFQRGDILILRKTDNDGRIVYSSASLPPKTVELRRRIAYILIGGQFGIEPGYVVMGLEIAPDRNGGADRG